MKVTMGNSGKSAVDVKIEVICNIGAVEGLFDVTREENRSILIEIAEGKIKWFCEKALHVAQSEYKTDIFGFGEAIYRKYPKLWETIKDDWNNEFEDLPVNIAVSVKLKQLGQITKPYFIKENGENGGSIDDYCGIRVQYGIVHD